MNRILGATPQPFKGIGLVDLIETIQRWLWKKLKITARAGCSHVRLAAFYHRNRAALRGKVAWTPHARSERLPTRPDQAGLIA